MPYPTEPTRVTDTGTGGYYAPPAKKTNYTRKDLVDYQSNVPSNATGLQRKMGGSGRSGWDMSPWWSAMFGGGKTNLSALQQDRIARFNSLSQQRRNAGGGIGMIPSSLPPTGGRDPWLMGNSFTAQHQAALKRDPRAIYGRSLPKWGMTEEMKRQYLRGTNASLGMGSGRWEALMNMIQDPDSVFYYDNQFANPGSEMLNPFWNPGGETDPTAITSYGGDEGGGGGLGYYGGGGGGSYNPGSYNPYSSWYRQLVNWRI